MTKNRTPTPVYLDPGMHPGLEVKGLKLELLMQFRALNDEKYLYFRKRVILQYKLFH